MGTAANDPVVKGRIASIEKPLQELGWVFGRDIEIHYRWGGGDPDLTRAYAKELIGMQPDVFLAHTNTAMAALHRETSATPIVFVMVSSRGRSDAGRWIWSGSRLFPCARSSRATGWSWRTSCRQIARLNEINRAVFNQKIDVRYDYVIAGQSIVLIRQSDFSGAGRSENSRNDFTCNVLISGVHSHHSNDVHFEYEVNRSGFAGGSNS
jgi:hypothetical protein